jgi:large subunit ribosomal protein L21
VLQHKEIKLSFQKKRRKGYKREMVTDFLTQIVIEGITAAGAKKAAQKRRGPKKAAKQALRSPALKKKS